MDNYVLYVHQNKINGKRYIGITNNIHKRWYGEGKKYKQCPRFAAAINKYGWDNFTHEIILSELSFEEANELEQVYIKEFRTCEKEFGYNVMSGGNCNRSMLGKHHSRKTRQKMRESALGRVIPEEQRKRHSEIMTGKMIGKLNPKSTAVRCVDTGEVFETQRSAAEATGVSQAKISLCCQGKRNHTHGLRWEYADRREV